MKRIIFLLISILFLTGCYDYRELNNLNIVNSIGIDYDGENYVVYMEIVKSSKKDDNSEDEIKVINSKNKNIAEAFKDAIRKSDKELYLKQSRLLMLSEELCKDGIMDVISYLLNDITLSNNYFLVIVNDIENVMKNDNSQSVINNLKNTYDNKKLDDIEKIAGDLLNKNKDIALPLVNVSNEEINISKIGYFEKDKLKDYVDNKIYDFLIKDKIDIEFSFDDNMVSVYKKKINYDIKEDIVIINVIGYGYANLINDKYDLKDGDSYIELQELLNNEIMKEINLFLDITLSNNSDLISLKDMYYKKFRKYTSNIDYEVNVDIKIDKNGSLYEGLYD